MRQIFFLLQVGYLFRTPVSCYTFALVPKTSDNPFFLLAQSGCIDQSTILNDTCVYGGVAATEDNPNPDPKGELQAQYVQELLESNLLDGLAISVKNATLMKPSIDQADIPVVTFDSDAPNSKRISYIGTDNDFMGKTLAKTAKQITPEGGTFVIMLPDNSPNVRAREYGFREEMKHPEGLWKEIPPVLTTRNLDVTIERLDAVAALNPTIIMTTSGGPLFAPNYAEFYRRHRHRNITIVSSDDFPVHIGHLSRGYVQGLVGQMPYEMGLLAIKVLHDLKDGNPSSEILGTNLITHIQVPLVLPELNVDNNLIGNFRIVGYILFGLIAATGVGCGIWVLYCRKGTVVKAAQPVFLVLVVLGVIILGATIVPLSFDDGGTPLSTTRGTWICMSVPWLAFFGFSLCFSALFSKLIRINRIMKGAIECRRVQVSATDVLLPFSVLLALNILILLLWSFLDPLGYVRIDNPGTDGWNRIISTYGACRCDNPWRYLGPLAAINFGVLITANWQAYRSRNFTAEFSESKYIGIAMISLLQASCIGIPILFVVRDSPQAFYLTVVFMIFVICLAILLLIFVPKMVLAGEYGKATKAEQQSMMREKIQETIESTEMRRRSRKDPRRNSETRGPSDTWEGEGRSGSDAKLGDVDMETNDEVP